MRIDAMMASFAPFASRGRVRDRPAASRQRLPDVSRI
jgi:hypothetical protein